jgi:hypothetical protein
MKKRLPVSLLTFLLLLPLSLLSACSDSAYKYEFTDDDIKNITIINSETSEEILLDTDVFGAFFDELKALEYKSYAGQIRGKEARTITIVLNDDSRYTFEAYFIIQNDSRAKYKCEPAKFNAFLDKYALS